MTCFAEFATAEDARRALDALRARGVRRVETYSPFPLTNDDAYAPRGAFWIAVVTCGAAVCALAASYGIQWYANAFSYRLNIGGRPAHAGPAFVPSTFESICLVGALTLFAAFLCAERLPRLWQPVFEIEGFERASVDRFWLAVDLAGSEAVDELVERVLVPMGPLRIVKGEEEGG